MTEERSRRHRYALHASAAFFGNVVEETFASAGETLQIGNSDEMAVPVPEGAAWLARARWAGPRRVRVVDGNGEEHVVEPDQPVHIEVGPVALTLTLVQRYRLRRTGVFPWLASLTWFVIVLMTTIVAMQADLAYSLRCGTVPLFEEYWPDEDYQQLAMLQGCFEAAGQGGGGAFTAEYLARLLKEDYAGADEGAIAKEIERQRHQKKSTDIYLPAGSKGPTDEMEGAAETAPEPVRTPPDSEQRKKAKETNLLAAPQGEPVPLSPPEEEADAVTDAADALEPEEEESEEEDAPPPAEEKEGWGIPDWMDEEDANLERVQIEVMVHYAKERIRIDPNDTYALSILSYYQYLANDLEAAEQTYDKIIALAPDDPAAYNNKALVYKRRGDYGPEEALYRQAIALDPEDDTAMNNLAVNLAHQGRFDEALAMIDEVERLNPGDPYTDLHRSKIHAEMGEDEAALAFLEEALQGMERLDTLHHIEFRQDIRVDPAFERLRQTPRFRAILWRYYGKDTPLQE